MSSTGAAEAPEVPEAREVPEVPEVPEINEVRGMSPAEIETMARAMDGARRRHEAAMAVLAQRVDATGAFLPDGHRSVRSWGKAACNWSGKEAYRLGQLGRAFSVLPSFQAAAMSGEIGVAQMHDLARVIANPRVRAHLAESEQLLVGSAMTLDHDDFVTFLRRWEQAADPDGADRARDRAHQERHASLVLMAERMYLDAVGEVARGVVLQEILDRFTQLEWEQEWLEGVQRHGAAMHAGLMERTAAQRRFDALAALFSAAAGSDVLGGEVIVNILVDQATFEHEINRAHGAAPEPLDPTTVNQRRCESDRGVALHPNDVLAAAMIGHVRRVVLGVDGVILDFGRKKRLFTGAAREAVLLSERRCIWPGCDLPASRCQADHTRPHGHGGTTATHNAGPLCHRHNLWKNRGYTTLRGPTGVWNVFRIDGSRMGWRTGSA